MRWEWDFVISFWRLALLRRHDPSPSEKRWGIGWRKPYTGMDGQTYQSWGCAYELC